MSYDNDCDILHKLLRNCTKYEQSSLFKQLSSTSQDNIHLNKVNESIAKVSRISFMLPDEIIYNSDEKIRQYHSALMFVDVSGFTDLSEKYTHMKDGVSRLTQELNAYIGDMVAEILSLNGDLLKFAGDAFLAMWKSTSILTMGNAVKAAIDCALLIQEKFGYYNTDINTILRVKIVITAGETDFYILGQQKHLNYVVLGQLILDLKRAEKLSTAGDILTTKSVWKYINDNQYVTTQMADNIHRKVEGITRMWKRTEILSGGRKFLNNPNQLAQHNKLQYFLPRETQFKLEAEVRSLVVLCINIVATTLDYDNLDKIYIIITRLVVKYGGSVNKLSYFDKDLMFLILFGVKGFKSELEAQFALICGYSLRQKLSKIDVIKTVSVAITSGNVYCGIVGHPQRQEYTAIGLTVNKAARMMVAYPSNVTCDKNTFLNSKLHKDSFVLIEAKYMKGISNVGLLYEFINVEEHKLENIDDIPLYGRIAELRHLKNSISNCISKVDVTDKSNIIIIQGEAKIGKTKLLTAALKFIPQHIEINKINLSLEDKYKRYSFIRYLFKLKLGRFSINEKHIIQQLTEDNKEATDRLHCLNTVFGMNFRVNPNLKKLSKIETIKVTTEILKIICLKVFCETRVITVIESNFIDKYSSSVLPAIANNKNVIILMTFDIKKCGAATAENWKDYSIIRLGAIDRSFYSDIICHMLNIQGITPELDSLIQINSDKTTGWIQNYIWTLMQEGKIIIKSVKRNDFKLSNIMMPLKWHFDEEAEIEKFSNFMPAATCSPDFWLVFKSNFKNNLMAITKQDSDMGQTQMRIAMLDSTVSDSFHKIENNSPLEVMFFNIYDILNTFEQLMIRCASILGENFTRTLLLKLLEVVVKETATVRSTINLERSYNSAVFNLFEKKLLKCAAGNFGRNGEYLLAKPMAVGEKSKSTLNMQCQCKGVEFGTQTNDIFVCGYMRFCYKEFHRTTYALLTENQKQSYHTIAYCILSDHLKKFQQQSPETDYDKISKEFLTSILRNEYLIEEKVSTQYVNASFSNQMNTIERGDLQNESENNENQEYIIAMYTQIVKHCIELDNVYKVLETFIEYISLNIKIGNVQQAMEIIDAAENLVKGENFSSTNSDKSIPQWQKDILLGRIESLKGYAMLKYKNFDKAKEHLYEAMKLFSVSLPNKINTFTLKVSKVIFRMRFLNTSRQAVGVKKLFFELVAENLCYLYELFEETQEWQMALTVAKRSYKLSLRLNMDNPLLLKSTENLSKVMSQLAVN